MKYLVATSSSLTGAHPNIGVIVGPRVGGILPVKEGRAWAADNDAFHGKFSPEVFEKHLARLAPYTDQCLFVVCPDVLRDARATLALYGVWAPIIREMGFPVAFVAQDGSELLPLPDADWLFIGGGNPWRAKHTAEMVSRAKAAGMRVHVGRVNSRIRVHDCAALGVDTVDGTHTAFRGIERGLLEVGAWLDTIKKGLWAS